MSDSTRDARPARERIVEAAEALMLAQGYPATTVDEICDAAGASKGSFYHAFGSKEELGLAVLQAFHDRNQQIVERGVPLEADPVERAVALLDHLLASAREMWGAGCLLGSLALDLAETNPEIARAVSDRFRETAAMLAGGFAPLAADAASAQALAERFIVVVEGALVLARAHDDWSYVERALDQFRTDTLRTAGLAR
ncbi:MAG: TetR/AcrR family transcriptional regulator [Longimicrobiales bacterium]